MARLALSVLLALPALLASAALGCGGDDAPRVDASIDADAGSDGGTFTGSQVNVLRAPQVGLLAAGRGTTITASDIALSQSLEATVSGLGVFAGGGASIELTGAVIEANEGAGGRRPRRTPPWPSWAR